MFAVLEFVATGLKRRNATREVSGVSLGVELEMGHPSLTLFDDVV